MYARFRVRSIEGIFVVTSTSWPDFLEVRRARREIAQPGVFARVVGGLGRRSVRSGTRDGWSAGRYASFRRIAASSQAPRVKASPTASPGLCTSRCAASSCGLRSCPCVLPGRRCSCVEAKPTGRFPTTTRSHQHERTVHPPHPPFHNPHHRSAVPRPRGWPTGRGV